MQMKRKMKVRVTFVVGLIPTGNPEGSAEENRSRSSTVNQSSLMNVSSRVIQAGGLMYMFFLLFLFDLPCRVTLTAGRPITVSCFAHLSFCAPGSSRPDSLVN